MARIRTIKPDFWTDEKVLGIQPITRLLFIGMWNFADDYGRLEFSPVSLKAKIFPGDNFTGTDVRDMLNELCSAGLLMIYSAKDKEYIEITGWHNQRIDKRQVSKIPAPFDDGSAIRGIPPTSADLPQPTPTSAPVMEGNGREEDSVANATGADAPPDPSIAEREYFARGKQVLGKSAGGQLANLKRAKGGNIALARAAVEAASQAESPSEYIAKIIRGPPVSAKPLTEFQRKQAETNDVRAQIRASFSGESGGSAVGLLPDHSGERSEAVRDGDGPTVRVVSGRSG